MYPLKISVDLLRLSGALVMCTKNESNVPAYFVAVPVSNLYIPKDRKSAHLMLNGIATPNSQYGDFLIKSFLRKEDYENLTKDEREAMPILGKATFMKSDNANAAKMMANSVKGAVFTASSLDDVQSFMSEGGLPAGVPANENVETDLI